MLLFRSEEHVDRWCTSWKQPRGALLSMEQIWGLARAWYHDRLAPEWRPKAPEEIRGLFKQLGLTSKFWRLI